MEQERNIVSIQEAVAVSNYKSQRELMMNILRKDTSQEEMVCFNHPLTLRSCYWSVLLEWTEENAK